MLLDNQKTGKVGDALKNHLGSGSALSLITGYISLYGFQSLKKELLKSDSLRLLITQAQTKAPYLEGDPFENKLKNQLEQQSLAREFKQWLEDKIEVKTLKQSGTVSQSLYHIKNKGAQNFAIQGASNLTSSGLGYTKSEHYEFNNSIDDQEGTDALLNWFDSIWNNRSATIDAKNQLLGQLDELAKDHAPNFIYFLCLYSVFKDLIDELHEDQIIKSKTGFKDTSVWNKLYKFQKDGVLGAIDKLERFNGCIIADSVGLGKTFEALAVIKYYELRNDRVLVLCPKKLRENWTVYTLNDKRNILAEDRFGYDVLNHTDLTRFRGMSGEINLETLNWSNYDLIVIDESHNFRNNNPTSEGVTRYSQLMDKIIRSGVKTKVLMLSATPVNNRMNDLKNQVAFITEGRDDAFIDIGINSIGASLRNAQKRFNQWLDLPEEDRNIAGLLERLNFEYFKLLDICTIARSRKHIEKYYDIAEIGKFPERLKPVNIKSDIDLKGQFPALLEINRTIRRLTLSAYSPLKYVKSERRAEYSQKYDKKLKDGKSVFKQVDREQNLIHLMRVNLLKRMESSINSFGLTVEKLYLQVENLLVKIEHHESDTIEELNIGAIDTDSDEFEDLLIGKKVKVLIQDMDLIRWKQDLEDDLEKLEELWEEAKKIDSQRDAKLFRLKKALTDKISNPINDRNNKAIIFTAYADTANYLYDDLADWAKKELGINTALITGSGSNKTNLVGQQKDLNALLTSFSPVSKERSKVSPEMTEEIDLLIATDCISEGQNLQDCDYLVNYDIHWNPVRIIQRFGRIDRLGSTNGTIQLVNFWPNMELDEYINLEARVSGRMVLLDISATGEENVIADDGKRQMNDLEYRRNQLQQLQEEVTDVEDLSGGVSITDLTLNDFKMDLSEYMKDNLNLLESAPTGLFAVVNPAEMGEVDSGVIFCLRALNKTVQVGSSNALAPYFMVMVKDDGEVIFNYVQSKKVLDVMKKLSLGKQEPQAEAIEVFNLATQDVADMGHYRQMLEAAIHNISGKSDEKGVESLFSRGGTVMSQNSFKGMDDFEVVCYLILKETA